jgi:hypothetical protein
MLHGIFTKLDGVYEPPALRWRRWHAPGYIAGCRRTLVLGRQGVCENAAIGVGARLRLLLEWSERLRLLSLECSAGAQSPRWAAGVCRLCMRHLARKRHVAFPAAVAPGSLPDSGCGSWTGAGQGQA